MEEQRTMKTIPRLCGRATAILLCIGAGSAAAEQLYVSQQGVNTPIIRYALPGGGSAPFANSGELESVPRGMALDSSGNLYVAYHPAFNPVQAIVKFDPAGNGTVFAN